MGMCKSMSLFYPGPSCTIMYTHSVHLSYLSTLSCLCMRIAASDSLTVRTVVPFPVIMWHIYFLFLLILLVTYDKSSHQWGKQLIQISIGYISCMIYNNGFWNRLQFCLMIWQQSDWPLFFILNFSVWNLSPIFKLWGWKWWVSATLNCFRPNIVFAHY